MAGWMQRRSIPSSTPAGGGADAWTGQTKRGRPQARMQTARKADQRRGRRRGAVITGREGTQEAEGPRKPRGTGSRGGGGGEKQRSGAQGCAGRQADRYPSAAPAGRGTGRREGGGQSLSGTQAGRQEGMQGSRRRTGGARRARRRKAASRCSAAAPGTSSGWSPQLRASPPTTTTPLSLTHTYSLSLLWWTRCAGKKRLGYYLPMSLTLSPWRYPSAIPPGAIPA